MELRPIIEAARAHIREGNTGAALDTLRAFLENNTPRYPDALRLLRALEANYGAARQQELKGILSFQEAQREYSRVNDGLFALLDDLEAGRPTPARSRRRWPLAVAAAVIVLAVAAVLFLRGGGDECPDFNEQAGLRVLLLPFQNIGSERGRPEVELRDRIRTLTQKNQLEADVEIHTDYDSERRAPDRDDAVLAGRHCGADLVVWGRYLLSDSARVNVNYVFTEDPAQEGSTGFQAFRDLTVLQSGTMLNRSLDDAIFSICAIMAMRAGNFDLAKSWLDKVKEPVMQDSAMLQWLSRRPDR